MQVRPRKGNHYRGGGYQRAPDRSEGQTLDALQYLITRILNRKARTKSKWFWTAEITGTPEKYLSEVALKMAEKPKRTGKPVVMSPLNAHDRRIVHLTLEKDKSLKTISRGEGAMKKIIISSNSKKPATAETPSPEE